MGTRDSRDDIDLYPEHEPVVTYVQWWWYPEPVVYVETGRWTEIHEAHSALLMAERYGPEREAAERDVFKQVTAHGGPAWSMVRGRLWAAIARQTQTM